MYRKSDISLISIVGGLLLALFVLIAVVACNPDDGGDTYVYYPHDSTHGYYDTHHHYHYYPKYGSGRHVVVVKPAPKSGSKPLYKAPSRRR